MTSSIIDNDSDGFHFILSVHSLVVCVPLYFGGCYFMDSFVLYVEVRKLGISSNHLTLV